MREIRIQKSAVKSFFSTSLRLCGVTLFLSLVGFSQVRDYTRWVNPFIGTGGHGHTFPGATLPFGMVQLSPDTRIDNWDGSSGYHYSDDIIYGFSHTHLSGTGIPDGCDILFMPMVGKPQFFAKTGDKSVNGYASKFSHTNERTEPGYYSVTLDDDEIVAEMTATQRVGFHRYKFPKGSKPVILLDLKWRDKVTDSKLVAIDERTLVGYRRSSSWAKNQTVYFYAEFSKPRLKTTVDINAWTPGDDLGRPPPGSRTAFRFDSDDRNEVSLKVAISYVSIEGARENLKAELLGWDFDKVRADAKAAWNKEFRKIEVSGGTDAQTTNFYTALYHTMIQPNVFSDVDGRYKGHDGKIHQLRRGERPAVSPSPRREDHYTVFSLWDTFRAAHPLYTIIDQKRTVDFINTFIRQYEQGGRLPVWELWGEETDTMIGYHAVSVIADAMAKGIEGFDHEKAYAAAKHSAELDHFGLAAYKKRGYISMEDENESVSKTLEYAYNDWCTAQMAGILATRREAEIMRTGIESGRNEKAIRVYLDDYNVFGKRARSFENLFDPSTGFMRPKKNGGFVSPFAPNEVTFNFTEGNSWVYSFFVPHDVEPLMELHGGPKSFSAKLDELFTTKDKLAGREQPDITGLIGQYAHGNEPSHHIVYLYNYAGEPWKTQMYVRKILDEFYKPTPDGLIGNEDCGQMSAWYILSALGFYPVSPGETTYALGSPLFKEARIRLENGKVFTVKAPSVSPANKYVRSAKINGRVLDRAFIEHADIMSGGVLEFEMTDKPQTQVMAKPVRRGDVLRERDTFVAVPVLDADRRTFVDRMKVGLSSITPDTQIYYTLDGSEPTAKSQRFDSPITINATANIKAIAVNAQGDQSQTVNATLHRMPNNWTVKIEHRYNRQYTGGGDEGLIDGIRGTVNFASGEWQGYQPQDLIATIDLQKEQTISKVGGGFLQEARSWIWMPTRIEFEVSTDGVNFTRVADIKTEVAVEDMKPTIRDYAQVISPVRARYVRVRAYNLGKIPAWHPGAGFDSFIFVDEIIIG